MGECDKVGFICIAYFVGLVIRKSGAGVWIVRIRWCVGEMPKVCFGVTIAGEDMLVSVFVVDLDVLVIEEHVVSRIAEGRDGDE